MRLVFPSERYAYKAADYIQEFYDYSSEINGTGSLQHFLKQADYKLWLKKVMDDLDIANLKDNRVPAYTYFYVREEDDQIVGMINIRLVLNDFFRTEGGHIGYSIRPTERGKHYGSQMLREGLAICKMLRIHDVIVTCDKDNPASAGVIRNCGGELDEEFYSDTFKTIVQRYIIHLK